MDPKARRIHLFIKGGLGNQLFQIAACVHLANKFGLSVLVHTTYTPREKDTFQGISRWPFSLEGLPDVVEVLDSRRQPLGSTSWSSKFVTSLFVARKAINATQRKWQFAKDSDVLRTEFGDERTERFFLNGTLSYGELILDQQDQMRSIIDFSAKQVDTETVSDTDIALHLRMGDRTPSLDRDILRITQYFQRALGELTLSTNSNIRIFSDSPVMARQLLSSISSSNLIEAPASLDAISSLSLMARHTVIIGSNSTFSWWASFIQSQGKTILPLSSKPNLEMRGLALPSHNFV